MTPTSPAAPPVLIVGHLSLDLFADGEAPSPRPGGAVSYAARTVAAFGERAAILTAGGSDADLDALTGHDVEVVAVASTLTFEFCSVNRQRRLRLVRRADRPLRARDLPARWRHPRLLILAPLLPDDIDLPSFDAIAASEGRAILAQGLQRHVDASSVILHASHPTPSLLDHCSAGSSVFLSEEEIAGWSDGDLDAVTARAARLVVTRGAAGADIYAASRAPIHVAACAATPVDTTGAGDVFATAFMLALQELEQAGQPPPHDEAAARIASACAAAAIERRGPVPLPARPGLSERTASDAGGAATVGRA